MNEGWEGTMKWGGGRDRERGNKKEREGAEKIKERIETGEED